MSLPLQSAKRWLFSLQGKFVVVASLCILVFSFVGHSVVAAREEAHYRQEMVSQCKVIAEITRISLTNVMVFNELAIMDRLDLVDYLDYFIMSLVAQDRRLTRVAIFDDGGALLAQSGLSEREDEKDAALWKTAPRLNETEITEVNSGKERIQRIAIPLNIKSKHWGVVLIGVSMKDMQRVIALQKREVFWIVIVLSCTCLTIVGIGSKVLSRPIIQLAGVLDGIKTHGDLESHSIALPERTDEIGRLQKSLLWMLQRLKEADRERKKTMEVLSQTEKMVSIGTLAAGVAHEINNPLGGIAVCFKNLMSPGMDEESLREHIEAIDDCLQRIKDIVDQLLDLSRTSLTETSPTDINGLLDRLLLLLRHAAAENKTRVVRAFAERLPEVSVDQSKLGQVFMNLMINALQAMDAGGVLTVETRRADGSTEVVIRDSGAGIPAEVMPHIFDPFFTTKPVGVGTGLGLSVSKSIVEQHGGVIDVESQVGVGTVFTVRLPLEPQRHA